MKLSKLSIVVAVVAMALPLCAYAMEHVSNKDFVQKAAIGGMFEVESSQLALEKSKNQDVRNFAQMMIDDHGKVNKELKDLLPQTDARHVMLPTDVDDKHDDLLASLEDVSGPEFDNLYVKDQIAAHKEAVDLFRSYAQSGKDKTLRDFANENLPTLKMHKQQVMQLRMQ